MNGKEYSDEFEIDGEYDLQSFANMKDSQNSDTKKRDAYREEVELALRHTHDFWETKNIINLNMAKAHWESAAIIMCGIDSSSARAIDQLKPKNLSKRIKKEMQMISRNKISR